MNEVCNEEFLYDLAADATGAYLHMQNAQTPEQRKSAEEWLQTIVQLFEHADNAD